MSVDVETAPAEPSNRVWCSKMVGYFRRNRNRVTPGRLELPDCDFLNLAPRRTLRVLRPSLKSGRYYEPQSSRERPESINDNFYTRWARRPHPSGNCRCSFRQSSNSSRLSTHEEKIISQEIQKIRSSLCEAERSGQDIQELERNLVVDLTQLEAPPLDEGAAGEAEGEARASSDEECRIDTRIEPLGECVKKRIVKDLDRYIGDLLDEILNDTIKAIAQADNPFHRERREPPAPAVPDEQPATFDINFAFHSGEEVNQDAPSDPADKSDGESGYVNRGFVGTAGDPDALDFHLRHGLNGDAILESADCIDSGINSVETIELQPEQEQNLEQSLIDIIDAKLGGASIGKSLEDLGMEIDTGEEPKAPKRKDRASSEAPSRTDSEPSSVPPEEVKPPAPEEKRVTVRETPVNSAVERASKSLDDVVEESNFNSLRLEFKRGGSVSSKDSDPKSTGPGNNNNNNSNVGSRVNKTMSVIRRRIATRLGGQARRKSGEATPKSSGGGPSKSTGRSGLELEDYRRRFPTPEASRPPRHQFKYEEFRRRDEDGVTLRKRKPMLVFIHGFGSSAEAFENQLRYFADLGYPCIAPDLLGHGLSSAPRGHGDYQFAKLLKDLEAVLLHYAFKPGQKCVIVAHNYGCSFATALASKYVGSVHQLVLISGGGPTPLAPPPSEGPGHCCLRASLAPLLFCGMNRAVLYSARGRQHPYCGPEQLAEQRPSHMRHVLRGMSWPEGDYVFHRRICTPTLLVHGLRDNKVSLVQECQMERTMIKAFLEAIPAAGHMPMTDCPEQLNHMIHCFIDLWKNKKW